MVKQVKRKVIPKVGTLENVKKLAWPIICRGLPSEDREDALQDTYERVLMRGGPEAVSVAIVRLVARDVVSVALRMNARRSGQTYPPYVVRAFLKDLSASRIEVLCKELPKRCADTIKARYIDGVVPVDSSAGQRALNRAIERLGSALSMLEYQNSRKAISNGSARAKIGAVNGND